MEKATGIPIDSAGLSITCGRDGTWLHFSASSGKSASLNIDAMNKTGIIGAALRDWSGDRQKQAAQFRGDDGQADHE